MLTALILASGLPLVAINVEDSRLAAEDTFVSRKAEKVLAGKKEGEVLCLDRPDDGSICLVRTEWTKAITIANAQPKLRSFYSLLARQTSI